MSYVVASLNLTTLFFFFIFFSNKILLNKFEQKFKLKYNLYT